MNICANRRYCAAKDIFLTFFKNITTKTFEISFDMWYNIFMPVFYGKAPVLSGKEKSVERKRLSE